MRVAEPNGHPARRWTIAALGLVAAAAVAVAVTYTPLFAAADIRLHGSGGIPREDVLSLARVDGRSNVFHLDTRAVERRLEADPRIRQASVTTSLPDRIRIEIVPRIPVAVIGSPEHLVGADGVVIAPAGTVDLPSLIRADGRPPGAVGLMRAAAAAGALDPALRKEVDAVVVETDGTLRVRLEAGFSAMFGDATELSAKSESLAALLAWMRSEGVTVVSADLTVPGSPTARLDRGSTAVAVP
jgi:cell division protein FtsQ